MQKAFDGDVERPPNGARHNHHGDKKTEVRSEVESVKLYHSVSCSHVHIQFGSVMSTCVAVGFLRFGFTICFG